MPGKWLNMRHILVSAIGLCVLVFVLFVCCAGATAGLVESQERLLHDILVLNSTNYQQLKTWQGSLQATIKDELPDQSFERTADVDFAWDKQKDNWYYRWKITSAETDVAIGGIFAGMLVDGLWHAVSPAMPEFNVTNAVTITPSIPPRIDITQEAFDPKNFFLLRARVSLQERYELWMEAPKITWFEIKVLRKGGLVTVEERNNTIEDNKAEYIFDMSKNGTLISTFLTGHGREGKVDIEWEEHDSVWVPSRYVYVQKSESQSVYREFAWKENVVNGVIADNTFAIDTLRLDSRSAIADVRDGSTVKLNSSKREHSYDFRYRPLGRSPTYRNVFYLIVFNVFALIIFFLVLRLKRK